MELKQTLVPLPVLQRGYGANIYTSDKKEENRIAYGNGCNVIIRDAEDSTKGDFCSLHKTANVNVARFSPNGEWIASGDATGKVIVWGSRNKKEKFQIDICSAIDDICWSADGKRICAVGKGSNQNAKVFMWDSGSRVGEVTEHTKNILSCDMRQERPFRLATCGEDTNVHFYHGPPFKWNKKAAKFDRYPNKIRFSPDSSTFCAVSACSNIVLWDGKTGDEVKRLSDPENGHKGAIYSFDYSPDSAHLITCGSDKTAKVWSIEEGKVLRTHAITDSPGVGDMQMSAVWFGDFCFSVSLDGTINFFDADKTDGPSRIFSGHSSKITASAASGHTFATGDLSGIVCVWRDHIPQRLVGDGPEKSVKAMDFNKEGGSLFVATADDKLRVCEMKSNEWSSDAIDMGGAVNSVSCGNQGDACLVTLAQKKIVIVKGGEVASTTGLKYKPNHGVWSPDDTKIAIAGDDKLVHIYAVDGVELKEERVYKGHAKAIASVAFSPCGTYVTSSSGNEVFVWGDSDKNLNVTGWTFHKAQVNGQAWSPDGKRVATVCNDLSVRIFTDTEKFKSKRLTKTHCHTKGIDACFWLDNTTLLTQGCDSTLRIYGIAE